MSYKPGEKRYESMKYNRCGRSGLKLPAISLGLWHNFGNNDDFNNAQEIIHTAFDLGITHFDIANNYGPPPGSAEINFARILRDDLSRYRDELIISSKAGYLMWDGPYGEWGSRKNLLASLDQSLSRLNLDYVDIFYSHRFDPDTPLEETMGALAHAVKSGKALYVGVSNYPAEETRKAYELLSEMGVHLLIHQPKYSMLERTPEEGLLDVLAEKGIGSIAFCPLAQGLLTNKYLGGIPDNSRAASTSQFLTVDRVTEEVIEKARKLNKIASKRGQSLAQMAIAWVLKKGKITSALIGASRASQVIENVKMLENAEFSNEELAAIDNILG